MRQYKYNYMYCFTIKEGIIMSPVRNMTGVTIGKVKWVYYCTR